MEIRAATRADADAICAIYNDGIAGRQATFEVDPRTPDQVRAWFDGELPFLVAADAGERVVGWARVSPYSDRCVYEGVGEHGVYVGSTARGQGVGRRLLEALANAAEDAGYYKLTSRVFTTNAASLAAHRAAGFFEVGVQPRHGRLDGEWKDCVLVERLLGPARACTSIQEEHSVSDQLEEEAVVRAVEPAEACCSTAALESCCEASAKAECCGESSAAAPTSCGCSAK